MAKNVLITGAAGKTGQAAVTALLAQGHHVRGLVRRSDERSDRLAAAGAEIVVGDLLDLEAVVDATKGVDGVYFTYPIVPGLVEAAAIVLEAAEENGVGAIVAMSQASARRDAASNATRQHWITERLLDHFSGTTTHIRPTLFAEWLFFFYNGETGEIRLPFADARHAPIAVEDLGRVIAAILGDPQPHAGKTYPLYGPVELDYHQIAAAMSQTLGREVRYVPTDVDELTATLERIGLGDPHFVQHMSHLTDDYRDGVYAGTNDNVRMLTGVEPMTVSAFVEQNKQIFQGSAA